jgi:dihydropteroate synthase
VEIATGLQPDELLVFLKRIEQDLGRQPTFRNGPRLIDLDILFFDNLVHSSEALAIPHPALAERPFVLIPLAEIAPDMVHPVLERSIKEIADAVDAHGVRRFSSLAGAGDRRLDWGTRTFIMGILNLTPDSFSGDGLAGRSRFVRAALDKAEAFVKDGADILDLGAESSRPGAEPVSAEVELSRLLPVLEALQSKNLPVILSIDTWKSEVARKCLEMGANWINDIWGLTGDPLLAGVIAAHQAVAALMHNRSKPGAVKNLGALGKSYEGADYADFLEEIKAGLEHSVGLAHAAGIPRENIILDPGIGFGKSISQNLALINRLDELKSLGFPLLAGPSRKSFIGQVLGLPVEEREEGTAAAVAISIVRGVDIVRVHDVKMMARVARMADAIARGAA